MKPLLLAMLVSLALHNAAPAAEFSTLNFAGKRFTVCRVRVHEEHLQLFRCDEKAEPFKRFDRLSSWIESRGQKLVFAMNAGMYRHDFSTVGLFVSDGQQTAPLNLNNGTGNFYLKPNAPEIALFVISDEPVNFYELAKVFRDHLHCPDALFLDGKVSSLHAPELKRSDCRAELGPIIAVTE
jgi:uncharacterized protein YigE (DUF2233 family)